MSTLTRPLPPSTRTRRHRAPLRVTTALAAVLLLTVVVAAVAVRYAHDDSRRRYLASDGWPARGQAAYAIGAGPVHASPGRHAVPIASVAKVMTALLVLRAAPLATGSDGFHLSVTAADVADTRRRADRDESLVAVRIGEVLSERQALTALLLPSANNVAIMLARRVAGTVIAFVARMNATARQLGMRHTVYTDPSGFAPSTRSTALDQLVLARAAMRNRSFAGLVALSSARLPVAGTVRNTDFLLGTHGFVGIKTGSDDAAGGCFAFRTVRVVHGRRTVLTGVVLGQRGHNLAAAGQYAALQLADRVVAAG
jgi:D-alanyl-D-alanine carboxypeptidase (penicillin-binding protein 5/6)